MSRNDRYTTNLKQWGSVMLPRRHYEAVLEHARHLSAYNYTGVLTYMARQVMRIEAGSLSRIATPLGSFIFLASRNSLMNCAFG